MSNPLLGSMGGGGGSTFRNRPDNLRSTDTFEGLIGLCSGRIRGLAPGGLKNLFVNDVPIEDGSGNKTLDDFNAILFNGDPAILKPVTLQLGGSSGATTVSLPLNNANSGATTSAGPPGDWRFANVTTPGVDYIDLRFVVSQLYKQDKNGIYDLTASLEVELQPSGSSTWTNPLLNLDAPTYDEDGFSIGNSKKAYIQRILWAVSGLTWADNAPGFVQITGKTTQAYVKELRIAVPNEGLYANKTWAVRVRLAERDTYTNDNDEERRTIVWESIAGVQTDPIGGTEEWRGLSYLQVNGKASDQLTGIPELKGIYDLTECKVPPASVWDSETRVYTGATWDGATTELKWTTCPAFQIKDLVEDEVSGFSALVPGSTLNKWDTLEASKWFAELVPDGKGGHHPRYSMHYLLDSAQSINDTIQYVAGAVGCYAWDEGDGNWRMIAEKPDSATALFTKENIFGEFSYSHTDMDTRFNDITGVFRSEDKRYEEDRVRVFDQPHIDNYGRRTTSLVLVGCTNRQEALRRIYLRMLTSLHETRQVIFTTNRQGSLVQPFSIIYVADQDLGDSTQRTTGRLVLNQGTRVLVRDRVRLEVGIAYKLHVTIPNPEYDPDSTSEPTAVDWRKPTITIVRDITNDSSHRGDVTELFISSPLPDDVAENAPIAFEAVGLPTMPKQYRVLSVEPQDDEQIAITALEVYTPKWDESDAVDEGVILAQVANKIIPPPENVNIDVNTFTSNYQTKRVLSVSWYRPLTYWFEGFKVEYSLNGGPNILLVGNTQDSFAELQEPQDGTYVFYIYTLDRRGGISLPTTAVYVLGEVPPAGSQKIVLSNPSLTVVTDYTGTALDGQLPVAGFAKFFAGETDVSADTTWTTADSGCTSTIDTDGSWLLTGVSGTGKFDVIGEYGGVTLTSPVSVTKVTNAPPAPAPGSNLVSITSFPSVSSSTYGAAPSPTQIIKSSASGTIDFSASLNYDSPAVVGKGYKSFTLAGKIAYRVASSGSGWTDTASETVGTTAFTDNTSVDDFNSESGSWTINSFTVSGLTPSTDYEFGPFFRKYFGASGSSTSPYGNITASS